MKRTPSRARTTPLSRLLTTIDHLLFRDPDLEAIRRGWQITRRPFHRSYRDPRWDLISACPECAGTGCADCQGRGTVRHDGLPLRASAP